MGSPKTPKKSGSATIRDAVVTCDKRTDIHRADNFLTQIKLPNTTFDLALYHYSRDQFGLPCSHIAEWFIYDFVLGFDCHTWLLPIRNIVQLYNCTGKRIGCLAYALLVSTTGRRLVRNKCLKQNQQRFCWFRGSTLQSHYWCNRKFVISALCT